MVVPEAAVDEHGRLVLREEQVECAQESLVTDDVANAKPVHRRSERDLRLRSRTPHTIR